MQRYRVNYVLLAGLLVGAVVAAGSIYGIWYWQMSGNASSLLERAEVAEGQLEYREAAVLLENYLKFRPEDDEVRIRQAHLFLEAAETALKKREIPDFLKYKAIVSNALFKYPSQSELRREYVDLLASDVGLMMNFAKEMLEHLRYLLDSDPDDKELLVMKAKCLIYQQNPAEAVKVLNQLVGFNPEANDGEGAFDSSAAIAGDDFEIYTLLMGNLLKLERQDEAIEVADQMVQINPESAKAYLARSSLYSTLAQAGQSVSEYNEKSDADLEKAYELEPSSGEVLLAKARQAQREEDFDKTREFLEKGLESGTDIGLFYVALAGLESRKGNYEAALDQIDTGLEKVSENQRDFLLIEKIDILVKSKNLAGAREIIRDFEERYDRKDPRVEYQEARILAQEDRWHQAMGALEQVRPKLAGFDNLKTEADFMLGMAYEKVGYLEKALEVFEQLLRENPENQFALGRQNDLLAKLGRANDSSTGAASTFTDRLRDELAKPEEEQDWVAFDQYIDDWAEENGRGEVQKMLLRTQVLVGRKQYAEARKQLLEAYKLSKDDLNVQRAIIRLVAVDPDRGPETALTLLDRTVKDFGDNWQLRLDRADLMLAINNDGKVEEVLALGEGIDDWETSHQVELWKGIANRLGQIGEREASEQAWQQVAQLAPNDLPSLMQVFNLALNRRDDEAMRDAQKKVLDLVGTKEDANWAFTEAARKYVEYAGDSENDKLRGQILSLIDTAIEKRPDWSAPYMLRAGLSMAERDYLKALEDYKAGFARGRGTVQALNQYVRLLAAQGSFKEALEELDELDPRVSGMLFGQLYPTILLNAGRFRDAAEAADRIADAGEENANVQLWYGQFMQGLGRLAEAPADVRVESTTKATEALAKAVELNADTPTTWMQYIDNLISNSQRLLAENGELQQQATLAERQGKRQEAGQHRDQIAKNEQQAAEFRLQAENQLREAQLTLEEDQLSLLMAHAYENLGRWFDAENLYRAVYEQNPDSNQIARQLAAFYLSGRYPLADGREKASVLINSILRQSVEDASSVSADDANWARRTAAQVLAQTGEYQNLLKAEKLLASNAAEGTLALQDKLQMAGLLANRPEPISRKKAIQLLEEVQRQQRLSQPLDLTLGRLYFQVGNWPKAREHMLTVITRYPEWPAVRDTYIRMLLQRGGDGDLRVAREYLRELAKIAPTSTATLELASQVYTRSGDKTRARQALSRMIPRDLNNLDSNQVRLVGHVAELLAENGDLDPAQKLMETAANRSDASLGDQLRLVLFVGKHRNVDRAFSMLQQIASDSNLLQVVEVANSLLRQKRDEVGDKYDPQINSWIDRAKRENPGSIVVSLAEADVRDAQGRYEDSAAIYREALESPDLTGQRRAVVLNNLTYLLALGAAEEQSPNEAVKLIDEAVTLLGPISDILDTRAVVYLGRGDYQRALDDMEYAVTDSPTASKYFHKAQAHMGLNQRSEAVRAWVKAEDLGLTAENVGRLEEEEYKQLATKIEDIQSRGSL